MMKQKSNGKPISSPGRSDKYPPPLMRFLRTNVGSRSRGRSRASPMFLRNCKQLHRSSSSAAAAETTQEPSSPKVTCMGQVRVGRSKNKKAAALSRRRPEHDDPPAASYSLCAWIPHAVLCPRPDTSSRRRRWGRARGSGDLLRRRVACTRAWPWRDCSAFFCLAGSRRREPAKSMDEHSPADTEPKFRSYGIDSELGEEGDRWELRSEEDDTGVESRARVSIASSSSPCSPPKNALLLTRCRSAPYRSSSLACRFWGSPLSSPGDACTPPRLESLVEEPKPLLAAAAEGESKVHPEEDEAVDEKEDQEEMVADDEEKERFLKKETAAEKFVKPVTVTATAGDEPPAEEARPPPPPPRLIRCKSEPARTAPLLAGYR